MSQLGPVLTRLLAEARDLGFFGPGPLSPQITHAQGFLPLLGSPASVVDLGSGGGLPVLVLVEALPDAHFTLVESMQRRAEFLRRAVDALDVARRVTVVEDRAELVGRDPAHRAQYDAATARSFAAPAVTAECAAPLLALRGTLVVSDPPAGAGQRWPSAALERLGLEVSGGTSDPSFTRLTKVAATSEVYPRVVGRPSKRPLW